MRRLIHPIHLLFACFFLVAPQLPAQQNLWVKTMGSGLQDYPEDVVVDASGNVYVGGFFQDTLKIEGTNLVASGQTDCYLAKYSVDGTFQWAKRYGWEANEFVRQLALDASGNVLLVGDYQDSTIFQNDTIYSLDTLWYGPPAQTYDVFVATIDPSGNMTNILADGWFASERFYDVALNSIGELHFAGFFRVFNNWNAPNYWGPGYDEAFMGKVNSNGDYERLAIAAGAYIDKGTAVDLIGDSLYTLGGTFQDTCYFRDSTVFRVTDFEDDIFIAQWDDTLGFRWVVQGGSSQKDYLAGLESDGDGNLYAIGHFNGDFNLEGNVVPGNGNLDGFLVKLDKNGNYLWGKALGGKWYDGLKSLYVNDQGEVYVGGYFQGEIDLGGVVLRSSDSTNQDAYIAKLSPQGTVLWADSYGGPGLETITSLKEDPSDGHLVATGSYDDDARFEQIYLHTQGGSDIFVMRVGPNGEVAADPVLENKWAFTAYPNPASDRLTLRVNSERGGAAGIRMLDLQGRVVLEADPGKLSPGLHELDLSTAALADGMYLVELRTPAGRQVIRVAVSH